MFGRLCGRLSLVALGVLVAGAVFYCLYLTIGTGLAPLDGFLARWVSPIAPALAALAIGLHIVSMHRSRSAWLLIALGQVSWALGALYYATVLWGADPMPSPRRPTQAGSSSISQPSPE